jgi:dolichol-phosphate mannosyltransferase
MTTLSVIIPTRNEAQSLPCVIKDLQRTLKGIDYKILIVDDGEDNTPEVLSSIKAPNLKLLRRSPECRNGLSGAVIDGLSLTDSVYVAVIDGDGQHPPEIVRRMLWLAQSTECDMVMASRYIEGGSTTGLDGGLRKLYSYVLRQIPRVLFPKLRKVTDPLSGCFLIRKSCVNLENVKAIGWKISIEILLFSNIANYKEISYSFCERIGGVSKAGFKVGLEYFRQILSLQARYYFTDTHTTSGGTHERD